MGFITYVTVHLFTLINRIYLIVTILYFNIIIPLSHFVDLDIKDKFKRKVKGSQKFRILNKRKHIQKSTKVKGLASHKNTISLSNNNVALVTKLSVAEAYRRYTNVQLPSIGIKNKII